MKKKLPTVLTIVGLLFLTTASFLFWQRNTPRRLSFETKDSFGQAETRTETSLVPETLVITDLGIKLPIYPAQIRNQKWEATAKGVSYLSTSPIPGEIGNSILYGHNWESLLGDLVDAKPGQEIEILFRDGSKSKFIIQYTQIVTPEETSILKPSEDTRITLYTCKGFLDRQRFVVTATLSEGPPDSS